MISIRQLLALAAALAGCAASPQPRASSTLPSGFVYLSEVAPTVVQDIRYAGPQNLVGRPLDGYRAPACILTAPAARKLAGAQTELLAAGLTLRVYDCYRPARAIADLVAWSKNRFDQRLKPEYYPRVDKAKLFALGYLDARSAHARGSAIDVTIERLPVVPSQRWVPGERSCIAPFLARYHDGSIDMGTNYDCMDALSRADATAGVLADAHRGMLRAVMERHGFVGVRDAMWWHFLLRDEPFPKTAFNFPVTAPAR
ncbi:MAG TPA: M15 family metallopeptidase [Candidatus Tumulicola sp.]